MVNELAQELNDALAGTTAGSLLSDMGRRLYFPKGIIAQSGEAKADSFGLTDTDKDKFKSNMVDAFARLDCSDDITAVDKVTVEVANNGSAVATQEIYVVRIGNSWYVDNTNIDTSALYFAKPVTAE